MGRLESVKIMFQLDPRRIEVLDPAIVAVLRAKAPYERVAMVCRRSHRAAAARLTCAIDTPIGTTPKST
jgi:hypothetical protein